MEAVKEIEMGPGGHPNHLVSLDFREAHLVPPPQTPSSELHRGRPPLGVLSDMVIQLGCPLVVSFYSASPSCLHVHLLGGTRKPPRGPCGAAGSLSFSWGHSEGAGLPSPPLPLHSRYKYKAWSRPESLRRHTQRQH